MNRSIPLLSVGFMLVLMGAGLFALTLGKKKPEAAAPANKKELREQEARNEETKKMRLGAGILAGIGLVLILIS